MKITAEHYQELREYIIRQFCMTAQPYRTMRQRWDLLHDSKFDTRSLYGAGLNDDHIDTALRAIGAEIDAAYRWDKKE